jgi:hypothetical protein
VCARQRRVDPTAKVELEDTELELELELELCESTGNGLLNSSWCACGGDTSIACVRSWGKWGAHMELEVLGPFAFHAGPGRGGGGGWNRSSGEGQRVGEEGSGRAAGLGAM